MFTLIVSLHVTTCRNALQRVSVCNDFHVSLPTFQQPALSLLPAFYDSSAVEEFLSTTLFFVTFTFMSIVVGRIRLKYDVETSGYKCIAVACEISGKSKFRCTIRLIARRQNDINAETKCCVSLGSYKLL
jgi:hypothetical protein